MSIPRHILIVGATSAIAEATARLWAAPSAYFHLVARDRDKLALVGQDLRTRGAQVTTALLDVNNLDKHAAIIDDAFLVLPQIDAVLIAHGNLPDQAQCEQSVARALDALSTNAISVISLLTLIANRMRTQGSGVIVVLGSVAGDRGRSSNYVYGSCKAMVAIFLEGLAGRLLKHGVAVIAIKPGFVDTPMTSQFKKGFLWASPEAVAAIIASRTLSARSGTFYAPRFWWIIMWVIKRVPARILHRLNI